MAQVGWVFLSEQGGRHRIGLYHGDRTGHVAIHCNLKIVQIDFSVKESRTYSFFVEDELCEVRLIKEKTGFSYEFAVNKTVDTPLNQARRANERKNRKYMAVTIGALIVLLAGILLAVKFFGKAATADRLSESSMFSEPTEATERRLRTEGKSAETKLLIVREAQHRIVFYGFQTPEGLQVSGKFSVPDTGAIFLPNGFPLNDRDAFELRYLPADPQVHRVNFAQPSQETIASYFKLAVEADHRAHPDQTMNASACLAQLAVREKGWQSLGELISQGLTPEQNPKFNRDSYGRLVRDDAFAHLIRDNCR
ncbi:MAG: hypothetical protein WCR52_19295 [Bacteroidota bacterium]